MVFEDVRKPIIGVCFFLIAGWFSVAARPVSAQLLFSFESDLEGWALTGFDGSDAIAVNQSTMGATEGTQSMAVESGNAIPPDTNAFSWDVGRTVNAGSGDVYDTFNTAAMDPTKYSLEFDVSITSSSFANVTSPGPFFLINASVNSDDGAGGGGFDQVFNVTPNLIGTDDQGNFVPNPGTYHVTIPFGDTIGDGGSLFVVPNSNYYQLNIGSNKNNTLFTGGGRGAEYYVDNIRIVEEPDVVATTLFSWETPDNPATPAVNEQFERWVTGFQAGHVHAISTTGATDGASALEIDRTSAQAGFSWGSQFVLSSDTNPDPQVEQIDPALQAEIDGLVDKINNSQSIAFDLTYQYVDRFPLPDPSFTKFGLHFTDETGVFYQSEQQGFINVLPATEPTTVTIEIPTSMFNNPAGTLNLAEDGLMEGTSFLRIGLASNTDGAQIYQIDNFRVISLAAGGLTGDYNNNGVVDAADYVVWRDNLGTNNTLPNNPLAGPISQAHFDQWRAHFGQSLGGGQSNLLGASVPEPATVWIAFALIPLGLVIRRRATARTAC